VAIDLAGIRNVGEFYSQHYLDSLFAGDVSELLAGWAQAEKDGGDKAPPKRLAALAGRYFDALGLATGNGDGASATTCLGAARDLHAHLLEVLGYTREPAAAQLDDGSVLPLALQHQESGRPFLWVLEAPFAESEDDADPFSEGPAHSQLPTALRDLPEDQAPTLAPGSYRELLDNVIFRGEHPPRWVLLLAGSDAFLIDRHKWHQGKYLHFELGTLFGRRDGKAMQATAALLHSQVLLPRGGQSLLERLDEQSHKHAYAVSTDLKFGAQRAIELIANESVRYLREVAKQEVFGRDDVADALTRECIVYLYRLLFLFYVEARSQETGVVPMGSEDYRRGYSLESLRDLELTPLTTVGAREGTYLDNSLRRLFRIVQHGYPRGYQHKLQEGDRDEDHIVDQMTVAPLRSALFDDEKTPILRRVKLRNSVLQEVLAQLSLSQPSGKGGQRGRISYAQLGINQLGAVYEGLLSYRGFFAYDNLFEVAAKTDLEKDGRLKPNAQTYFVPEAAAGDYSDNEFLKDEYGRRVAHQKGTYLFRLAGRDREKSASYYTPQVLTECLVKYTLLERLGESFGPADTRPAAQRLPKLPADAILNLTLCEPAMGSGAFLNEAIDQLAHRYLLAKQAELGITLPAEQYPEEHQKVKYHFAVNQSYGVDLNPLAAELGKVSVWLNVLHQGALAPFLDLRLRVGNSLVGARREVFHSHHLTQKNTKDSPNWLGKEPTRVPLGTPRPSDSVYHFLLPDAGMVAFDGDKVVSALEPAAMKAIKEWKKAFTQPLDAMDVRRLLLISSRVDTLFERHQEQRESVLAQTRQVLRLWGQPASAAAGSSVDGLPPTPKDAQSCEEYARQLSDPSAPGQRLRALMDYWCALFFWPISEVARLPSREQWLRDLEAITDTAKERADTGGAAEMDPARRAVVAGLAGRLHFFHWELEFPEVFKGGGGMDVIVGNPPWLKVEWQEGGVLSDFEPLLAVKGLSAKQATERRAKVLEVPAARAAYLSEFEAMTGTPAYLNAVQNYPALQGVQTNLYKCFMEQALRLGGSSGCAGILHQKGLYDDPRGGRLRKTLAQRLALHLHLINKLLLFSEIKDEKHYEMSMYRSSESHDVGFVQVSNLFHPRTLDDSFQHDGLGPVPGIKDLKDNWVLQGHASRLVPVDASTLALFAQLYDKPGTSALEARLPVVHSREILDVLQRFAKAPRKLADLGDDYFATVCFDETGAQRDGTIARGTRFAKDVHEWVVSGPHFYVGNPFNKTPNEGCKHNQDYSPIDLTVIPDDYLPRTNFVPACSPGEYRKRTPEWRGRPVTEFYRHANRQMVAPTGERTHIPALLPPGCAHVLSAVSVAFHSTEDLLNLLSMGVSLPADFFVKASGRAHVLGETLGLLPMAQGPRARLQRARCLRLNSVTRPYAELWREHYVEATSCDAPTKPDPRAGTYAHLTPEWTWDTPLRTPFERRQALVELDALAALSLDMTLDELLLIYRVQFPVLQQYERETFYDQRGKIVFTVNRGLSGVGVTRAQWGEIQHAQAGDTLPEWAVDQQGAFVAPFDACDREADMAQAYEEFRRRIAAL
jgi:hypothetical protein